MTTTSPREAPKATDRLAAVDVMRGLVMVLMTIDHASEAFNGGRVFTDAMFLWKPGSELPAAQFLTRWITHLCAPTFVLLAGVALAISCENRQRRGESARAIDLQIVTRGLLLIALEIVWMSPVMLGPGRVLLQVLYALGLSFVAMAALRRLSDRALLGLGLVILLGGELLLGGLFALGVGRSIPSALLIAGGIFFDERFIVGYPVLPWLGMMCLGWVLGRKLLAWGEAGRRAAVPMLLAWGVAGLAAFAILRGVDGYGNMFLHRDDGSLVHWLHVSKYPPSVTYVGLELGLMALILAGLFHVLPRKPGFAAPLRLLGQVALFYYLLHAHLLTLAAWVLGIHAKLGVVSAYVGALIVLAALLPVCGWYRRYKAAHPNVFTRYV